MRSEPRELAKRLSGTPLIIMLDIDGTLCDIVERPGDARVPPAATESLRRLSGLSDRGVHLAFVTGRAVSDARGMVGVERAIIYGNHGMERLSASGDVRKPDDWAELEPSLRDTAREINDVIPDFPGARLEDKRFSFTLHYRDMDTGQLPELKARVNAVATRRGFEVADGKMVMNIVPAGAFNKGNAALEIVGELVPEPGRASASILFAGDDVTDEDAFIALRHMPNALTVCVGDVSRPTAAKWSFESPLDVHELLELLLEGRA